MKLLHPVLNGSESTSWEELVSSGLPFRGLAWVRPPSNVHTRKQATSHYVEGNPILNVKTQQCMMVSYMVSEPGDLHSAESSSLAGHLRIKLCGPSCTHSKSIWRIRLEFKTTFPWASYAETGEYSGLLQLPSSMVGPYTQVSLEGQVNQALLGYSICITAS